MTRLRFLLLSVFAALAYVVRIPVGREILSEVWLLDQGFVICLSGRKTLIYHPKTLLDFAYGIATELPNKFQAIIGMLGKRNFTITHQPTEFILDAWPEEELEKLPTEDRDIREIERGFWERPVGEPITLKFPTPWFA